MLSLFDWGRGPSFILGVIIGVAITMTLSFFLTIAWRKLKDSFQRRSSSKSMLVESEKPAKNIAININRNDGPHQYNVELVDSDRSVRFDVEFPSHLLSTELNSDNLREFLISMKVSNLPEAGSSTDSISPAEIRMRKAIFETVKSFEINAGENSTHGALQTPLPAEHMFYRLLEA
jgi:hypothetical protein